MKNRNRNKNAHRRVSNFADFNGGPSIKPTRGEYLERAAYAELLPYGTMRFAHSENSPSWTVRQAWHAPFLPGQEELYDRMPLLILIRPEQRPDVVARRLREAANLIESRAAKLPTFSDFHEGTDEMPF